MGILLYNEFEICQICMGHIDDDYIDGPSLKNIIIYDDINENCNHFFHFKCIKNEYDDFINNQFPFKLHCLKCGYLRKYSYSCFWELTIYRTLINKYTDMDSLNIDEEFSEN